MRGFADVDELEEFMTRPSAELQADLSGIGEILVLGVGGKKTPRQLHRELGALLWDEVGMARNAVSRTSRTYSRLTTTSRRCTTSV